MIYKVKILKLVEDEVEVDAVNSVDALNEAAQIKGVAWAIQAYPAEEE